MKHILHRIDILLISVIVILMLDTKKLGGHKNDKKIFA